MTLGRIIYATKGEQYSIIPLKWLTKTFVTDDVTCFLIQGTGGGFQSVRKNPSLQTVGKWIVVSGLILQIAAFLCFCYVAATYHRRMKRVQSQAAQEVSWQKLMDVLYVCSSLIIVRNIVRVVEYAEGFRGWIITHEFMLFVFDALPMLCLVVLLFVFHPARLLQGHLEGYRKSRKGGQERDSTSSIALPFFRKK